MARKELMCGRMSEKGEGYCFSYGWGQSNRAALVYFDGFPFNPVMLKLGPEIGVKADEQFFMSLLLNSSDIKGKLWKNGEQEPGWQVEAADNKFSSGSYGYYAYYTNAVFSGMDDGTKP